MALGWQLEILERGVEEWEQWRLENLTIFEFKIQSSKFKNFSFNLIE